MVNICKGVKFLAKVILLDSRSSKCGKSGACMCSGDGPRWRVKLARNYRAGRNALAPLTSYIGIFRWNSILGWRAKRPRVGGRSNRSLIKPHPCQPNSHNITGEPRKTPSPLPVRDFANLFPTFLPGRAVESNTRVLEGKKR